MEVLLFGLIAEKAGATSIAVEARSITDLRRQLSDRIKGLDGSSYAIAIDRRIETNDRTLTGSEEIAVLPPFAGG